MATTAFVFSNAMLNWVTQAKPWDFDSHSMKGLLTTSSYTPNQDTHAVRSDVTNEVTGTNYSAGGVALTSKSTTLVQNVLTLLCGNVTYSNVTIAAIRRQVFYDANSGVASTDPLWMWEDFGADFGPTAQDFVVQVDPSTGLMQATASNAAGFP